MQHESEKTFDDCSEGLAVVHAFETCKLNGAVDESIWPYDDTQVCWDEPPNTGGAARYRFRDYGYVYRRRRTLQREEIETSRNPFVVQPAAPGLPYTLRIQRQLFSRRQPVCVSVPVVWDAWPWNGNVQMPSPASLHGFFELASQPEVDGWHAVSVCGWSNSSGRFLFKNSWGDLWGDDGYGTIPYQYIELYSDLALVGW